MKTGVQGFRWPLRMFPAIATAGRYPLPEANFSFRYLGPTHALHLHDYEATLRMGKTNYRLQAGDVTLTPAGVPSWYDLPRPGDHWCVHFHPAPARVARGRDCAVLPLHIPLGPRRAFAATRMAEISRLNVLSQSGSPSARQIASAARATAFQEFILWLAMAADTLSSGALATRADAAVERAAAALETRLADPPTAGELSDQMELTQNYLARKFRIRFGITIPRYILTRRIEHASLLLANTDIPIQRIAMRVGLPDPQHFNKQFRKLVGMSPSQWRKTRAKT